MQELVIKAKAGIGLMVPILIIGVGKKTWAEFGYLHCPLDILPNPSWDDSNQLSLEGLWVRQRAGKLLQFPCPAFSFFSKLLQSVSREGVCSSIILACISSFLPGLIVAGLGMYVSVAQEQEDTSVSLQDLNCGISMSGGSRNRIYFWCDSSLTWWTGEE